MLVFTFSFNRIFGLIKKGIAVSFFVFSTIGADAQSSTDTIEIAKDLKNKGQLKAAAYLFGIYHSNHADNLNAIWLYAQTEYWQKHFKTAEALYEKALKTFPENYYLKIDFVKMLAEIGKFEKAERLLTECLLNEHTAADPQNKEIQLLLAKIYFWQGKCKEARNTLSPILTSEPKNGEAISLLNEILLAQSVWLKINAAFSTDNQPLQNSTPSIEAGKYINRIVSPRLNFSSPFFIANGKSYNIQWLQAGNAMQFNKIKLAIDLDAGILKQAYTNQLTWTGNLELRKTLPGHFMFAAKANRKPYYSTTSSMEAALMVNNYAASIDWNNMNSWNGKAVFEVSQYPDNNHISAFVAWLFTPALKISLFEFRLGYAYSFNTSKENRYVSTSTINQIATNYNPAMPVSGIYNPYFTPYDQQIHAALATIVIHPAKLFETGVKANIGAYATRKTPYLYLDKNSNTDIIVKRTFFDQTYFPVEINAYVTVHATNKINLKAEYTFLSTSFYNSHYIGLSVKINFWNEKKTK